VSRVIEDDNLPDSVKVGVATALYRNGNVVDYVLEEMVNNIGLKAERMYAYGRDHYAHGLPSGSFAVAAEDIDTAVGTVLLGLEGAPVTLSYVYYGPPNSLHTGWMALISEHGYDPATNQLGELTTTLGTPVYLHDMVVVIPETGMESIEPRSLEQLGIAAKAGYTPQRTAGTPETRALVQPSPIHVDPVGSVEFLRVEYVWVAAGVVQKDSFTIPIEDFDDESDYFHARYSVGGIDKYWMYEDGEGTYSTLDRLYDPSPVSAGSFFPFAYFRYDKVSETEDMESASYLTGKKLVSYLGIDYDSVADSIDSNPDIDDVEQAMLMLAVPAVTENELERRYLWEFFNNLFLASGLDYQYESAEEVVLKAAETHRQLRQDGLQSPGIIIQDARFKLSLDNQGVFKRRVAGTIGPVGTHDSAFSAMDVPYTYMVEGESTLVPMTTYESISSHFYRRQISHGFYDEIQVVEMRTVFHIFGKYSAIGQDEDKILLIPLDRSITSEYSIPERETLYARSLHFVFNSRVVVKVKWYETGIFKVFLQIVAIVVIVWSWGSAAPGVLALLAAGAYAAAALIVLEGILWYLVSTATVRLFVKLVGLEAALLIAVLAAAAGMYQSIGAESLAGAPFAKELLTAASNLVGGITAELQSDFKDLIGESQAFDLLKEEQTKLLETAQDLLDSTSILSPFVIFGEDPDDFYNRTVHSGNIGVIGISAISSYVDRALTLPELKDTLGEYS
jgi:hypothetical protein